MECRRTPFAQRIAKSRSEGKVSTHNFTTLFVRGVQPSPNSFRGKTSVRERADKRPPRTKDAHRFGEHLQRSNEVINGDATHHSIEGGVREWQHRIKVQIMHDPYRSNVVRLKLLSAHAEHGEACRWDTKVRDPGAHEIEHVAVNFKFLVESSNRSNSAVINVGDQPRPGVERFIGGTIRPLKKSDGEGFAFHLPSLSCQEDGQRHTTSLLRQTFRSAFVSCAG